jgi:hypothetical protein
MHEIWAILGLMNRGLRQCNANILRRDMNLAVFNIAFLEFFYYIAIIQQAIR